MILFTRKTLALAALLTPFCSPTPLIRIQIHSQKNICYKVEYSNGTGAFPNTTICGVTGVETGGFWLSSGQIVEFNAIGFNSAITAVLNKNKHMGARNEINFLNPTKPFYDVDYQYGISDGTCGPSGSSHLSGERDTLGKANKAWHTLKGTKKSQLTKSFPDYLRQDANGSLTNINMREEAWPSIAPEVVQFFQVTANFTAYMSPGSVFNVTWPAGSMREVVITSY